MNKSWSDIDSVKWKSVDIESPWYTNDAPIDDKHVRITYPSCIT